MFESLVNQPNIFPILINDEFTNSLTFKLLRRTLAKFLTITEQGNNQSIKISPISDFGPSFNEKYNPFTHPGHFASLILHK